MDFMNDYIPIIVGTKLAFSENIFEYKRIIIFVIVRSILFDYQCII